MNPMVQKLLTLWPEMVMGIGACVCLFLGLWSRATVRRSAAVVAGMTLMAAGYLVVDSIRGRPEYELNQNQLLAAITMTDYVKLAVVGVGLLLLLAGAGLPDELSRQREADSDGPGFDPANVMRGEFFAFFLLSLTGVMLTAGADDLVWLFLALELTSLPTYVMVAVSRERNEAKEAAVKYFFLGAMAAAVFLYGFALIYGATGSTRLVEIRSYAGRQMLNSPYLPPLFLTGMVLAIVGVSFKIAAAPMHFYVADVYQGASSSVTAFLAFVPKTAGFVALILLVGLAAPSGAADSLPLAVMWLLWGMAAASMTIGNVLGLLQTSVKRALAYSSVAQSGYMLVGLLAGASMKHNAFSLGNGIGAVLFYLVAYGLATVSAFSVLGCLRVQGEEADSYDDLAGLHRKHPVLAAVMLVSVLSLIGLPPLVGFLGKIYLFGSAIHHGFLALVVIAVVNSAVSAVYYLRIVAACYFQADERGVVAIPGAARKTGAVLASIGATALGFGGSYLIEAAKGASDRRLPPEAITTRVYVQAEDEPKEPVTILTPDEQRGADEAAAQKPS